MSQEQVDQASKIIDEITDLLEELPERAADFHDSIEIKVCDIAKYIEERNHVTPGQLSALENMLEGVARWIHR